jgi:hypothetical protein
MSEQPQYWVDFYENSWEIRRRIFAKLLAEGNDDPLSIIKKFECHDLHFRIGKRSDGTVFEEAIDYGELNYAVPVSFPMTGIPVGLIKAFQDGVHLGPFYESINQLLVDHISFDTYDAIIELGAGYGKRLIEIWYGGGPRNIPYYAGEFTESGLQSIQFFADLRPEMRLTPFHFDHKKPDLSAVAGRKVFIFTCHSIEQVTLLPDDYFEKLAGSFESVTCVHLEPFGFQMEPNVDDVTKQQQADFVAKQWNGNFVAQYESAARAGKIKHVFIGKNIVPGKQGLNPTSVAIWTNKTGGW